MTERRSEYRKRQSKKRSREILNKVKSAFDDNSQADQDLDVVSDFRRGDSPVKEAEVSNQFAGESRIHEQLEQKLAKPAQLKKHLNHAILLVTCLIVLVLLALFYL